MLKHTIAMLQAATCVAAHANVADFDVVYIGTGPGASMTGALKFNGASLFYKPSAVVSDLVYRSDFD